MLPENHNIISRTLPISEFQKRFFIEWLIEPNECTYNISQIHKLSGQLDKKRLKNSCKEFIERNEVVHARYSKKGESCYYGDFSINNFFHELTFGDSKEAERQIQVLLFQPFDLTKGPLLRIFLIELNQKNNSQEFYFFFVCHHIICDGVWMYEFFEQVRDGYNETTKHVSYANHQEISFTEAVKEESKYQNTDFKSRARRFWLNFIGDTSLRTDLSALMNIKIPNEEISNKNGAVIHFNLNRKQTHFLRTYASRNNVTLFVTLLALYGFVLSKYSLQKNFLISYPVDTRSKKFKKAIGCLVNNIPAKFVLKGINSLSELIAVLGDQRRQVKRFQNYSSINIIQDLIDSKGPQTDVYMNIGFGQTYLNTIPLGLDELKSSALNSSWSKNSIYEISLLYDDYRDDCIKFKLEYRKSFFTSYLMKNFLDSFYEAIDIFIKRGDLSEPYTLMRPAEYDQVVKEWNRTDV
ncbi:condensation domain-containing protein, partial [Croceitalea sp. MTPC5]|uniref:condensation domain-containing protein n=1 Tax=Croceitalea sp. MTPC5 TaxID=3056565 RepID=UPI0030CEF371